jgi:hypothetical protein
MAARAPPSAQRRLSRAETFTFNAGRDLPPRELAAVGGGIRVTPQAWFPSAPDRIESGFTYPRGPDDGTAHPIYGAPVDPGGWLTDPGTVHPMYGAPLDQDAGGPITDDLSITNDEGMSRIQETSPGVVVEGTGPGSPVGSFEP